jgi:hypothetical protein
MRRFLFAVAALSLCGAAAITACSSDDSSGTTTTDAGGTDSGTTDVFTPPTDTGVQDTGTKACQTCSSFLSVGPAGQPCTTGSPSSADLITAFYTNCMCASDGGGCFASCGATCTSFANPDETCVTCFSSTCGSQLAACEADGTDAGPQDTDAGDAGDGGDAH